MIDFTNFERVFGSLNPFPYDRAFIQDIDANRRVFEGILFIDRVLAALGYAKVAKSYPPKSESILRQLFDTIVSSDIIGNQHKLSVLYYLLLDIDGKDGKVPSTNSRSKASNFARNAGVPQKYQTFMQGLWLLDRQIFAGALEKLADPSLSPEFADDIMTLLVKFASRDGDYTLPLTYYYTVQPVFKSPRSIELLFNAISHSNVAEALIFSRGRPEQMREQLFRRLILSVLEDARDEDSAERAYKLASLALDNVEEAWYKEILTSGEAKTLNGARDMLLMRRVANGEGGPGGEKGTWGVLMEGFKVGSGGRT